jgi:predicted lysophospholipase L1 biosynthesis ABC-type transport system permease subunit
MNDEMKRRIEIATALGTLVMAFRTLRTELRRGRRLHTGHAALKLAAAVVGAVIAVRAIKEVEEGS